MRIERVLIMGAAGRDFHDFNVVYRDDPSVEVVAFTATQIPGIADRRYPPELAGARYPAGIPIRPEAELETLIRDLQVDTVVFAYSDVSHEQVMHAASRVLAAGADFSLLGPDAARCWRAPGPVVSVCAVRTGSGKSQTSRYVARALEAQGLKVAVVRHPMPYGDLVAQRVQRFETYADLDRHETTIEEREEYEPHLDAGRLVFAGVDYEQILRAAEAEADVVIWDGGNNDLPFYRPDLAIVVADPLRPGHELRYHPGEANLRLADVVVINKVDSATPEALATVRADIAAVNPRAAVVEARSSLALEGGEIARPDRGRGRGRPDAHARRHDLRRRRRGGEALRRGRDGGSAARTPRASWPTRSRSTRISSGCCRRWATATSRSTSWRPRWRRSRPTWSSPRRPIDLTRVLTIDEAGRPRPVRAGARLRARSSRPRPGDRPRRGGLLRHAAERPRLRTGRSRRARPPAGDRYPSIAGSTTRTAVPRTSPAASRASATFASASGCVSTSVVIPIRAASERNSRASCAGDVGDAPDRALPPQVLVGHRRQAVEVDRVDRDDTAPIERTERAGHDGPDGRERHGGVQRDRRPLVQRACPGRPELQRPCPLRRRARRDVHVDAPGQGHLEREPWPRRRTRTAPAAHQWTPVPAPPPAATGTR